MKTEIEGLSTRLQTVKQFCAERPAFTEGGLRWLIFNECESLKKEGAVLRVRGRLLIDPLMFDRYLALKQR